MARLRTGGVEALPAAVLVTLTSELGDAGIHLGGQRLRQHRRAPSRAISSINDDPTAGRALVMRTTTRHYGKHGRAFPTDAPTSALLETLLDQRKGTFLPADPQVSSIARSARSAGMGGTRA